MITHELTFFVKVPSSEEVNVAYKNVAKEHVQTLLKHTYHCVLFKY